MRVILLLESLPLMVKPHALPEQPSASHPSKSPLNPLYPNTYIHIVIHTHTYIHIYIYKTGNSTISHSFPGAFLGSTGAAKFHHLL